MKRYDMIIVGAGPAGLSAAIEAAKRGMKVVVYDENAKPGGQLFKQIHKFFGSKEHKAKIRGFHIGEELLNEANSLGVEVVLNAIVIGLFPEKEVTVKIDDHVEHVKGDKDEMGMSPKQLAKIVRFQTAVSALNDPNERTLTQIAADLGYFDQAHFVHDFKSYTGLTPKKYQTFLKTEKFKAKLTIIE